MYYLVTNYKELEDEPTHFRTLIWEIGRRADMQIALDSLKDPTDPISTVINLRK